jgi:hypothetical protein
MLYLSDSDGDLNKTDASIAVTGDDRENNFDSEAAESSSEAADRVRFQCGGRYSGRTNFQVINHGAMRQRRTGHSLFWRRIWTDFTMQGRRSDGP